QTKVTPVLVWTAFNKDVQFREFRFLASEDDHKLSTEFNEKMRGWIEDGKIKPNRPKVLAGGLDAVKGGFQEHRDGKISAEKLVYEL
ncbi:hypothetical protein FZEAL_10831, partial [Fusarium zealandicum]